MTKGNSTTSQGLGNGILFLSETDYQHTNSRPFLSYTNVLKPQNWNQNEVKLPKIGTNDHGSTHTPSTLATKRVCCHVTLVIDTVIPQTLRSHRRLSQDRVIVREYPIKNSTQLYSGRPDVV